MNKIKSLKFRTSLETKLAKLVITFNRKVKGVKADYNLNYCGDKSKFHTLDVLYPSHSSQLPCVLYLHGGGWSAYDKSVFRSTCKRLASKGAVVFNCNFRLAPQFTIEDMQEDIKSILGFISRISANYGGNSDKLIFAGDSAGAHLLSLFINKAAKCGEKEICDRVKACVFFYGVYNLTTVRYTGFKVVETYLSAVVSNNTLDYEHRLKELSPVNYVVKGLPPTLICSGKVDLLHKSQSEEYADILESAGVPVQRLFFPEECKAAKHKFITFDKNKAAVKAFEVFGEFISGLDN